MELHLMYVNVCKWNYHLSFVILTSVLLKVQVLMAVTSGQPVNGNPVLVDTLKQPRRLGSLRNHHVIINCCKVIIELMTLYFEIFLRGFVKFFFRFIQDISGGISCTLGNLSCVKWHRYNLKYLYVKLNNYGGNQEIILKTVDSYTFIIHFFITKYILKRGVISSSCNVDSFA
jgi:hypothetical protein